jgi:maltose alpha-D-glucosyltransferase/alpha-amylase
VFGRGTIEFVRTDNRKVLTYVRRHGDDVVLCVANLSRAVQPVVIPLSQFSGLTPVEMLGQTQLPRIGDQPYFLTLAPYGFYWFQLQETVVSVTGQKATPLVEEHPPVPALFAGVVWDSILDGSMRTIIEKQAIVPFLQRQRWFGGKARGIARARFVDWATLRRGANPAFLGVVDVEYRDGGRERYVLPLAMTSGAEADEFERDHGTTVMARITGARKGLLFDGLFDDGTCTMLLTAIEEGRDLPLREGHLLPHNHGLTATPAEAEARSQIERTGGDQSNTSVMFGWQLIMKMFRRLEAGENPDAEIGQFLTDRQFNRVPPLLGTISYTREGEEPASLVMLQRFVPNQGNAWEVTIEELRRYFENVTTLPDISGSPDEARQWLLSSQPNPPAYVVESVGPYLSTAEVLGRRTGELHMALASAPDDPRFAVEFYAPAEITQTAAAMRAHGVEQLRLLDDMLPRLDDRRRHLAAGVLAQRDDLLHQFEALETLDAKIGRIRCHGDYHLGQVLVTEGDVVIIDFEGEPARPVAERRAKTSPIRDVAGMLRSFSYAALTGLGAATQVRPDDVARLAPWADLWETWVGTVFLRAYLTAIQGAPFIPATPDRLDVLLQAFTLDKALYELGYELNNRPDWVHIPLTGLMRLGSLLHA